MPIYEYQDKDSGEIIELIRPVCDRHDCPPNLMPVISLPARPRIGRDGLPDPSLASQAIPQAFKECEQRIGTTETCRRAGFTAAQIKQAWSIK